MAATLQRLVTPRSDKEHGVSLLELMAAIAVFMVIFTGVISVMNTWVRNNRSMEQRAKADSLELDVITRVTKLFRNRTTGGDGDGVLWKLSPVGELYRHVEFQMTTNVNPWRAQVISSCNANIVAPAGMTYAQVLGGLGINVNNVGNSLVAELRNYCGGGFSYPTTCGFSPRYGIQIKSVYGGALKSIPAAIGSAQNAPVAAGICVLPSDTSIPNNSRSMTLAVAVAVATPGGASGSKFKIQSRSVTLPLFDRNDFSGAQWQP